MLWSWYDECSSDVLSRSKETYEVLTSCVNRRWDDHVNVELGWVIGRGLGPHLGNFVCSPQLLLGVGLEMILASIYSTHYHIKVHIDLRVEWCP